MWAPSRSHGAPQAPVCARCSVSYSWAQQWGCGFPPTQPRRGSVIFQDPPNPFCDSVSLWSLRTLFLPNPFHRAKVLQQLLFQCQHRWKNRNGPSTSRKPLVHPCPHLWDGQSLPSTRSAAVPPLWAQLSLSRCGLFFSPSSFTAYFRHRLFPRGAGSPTDAIYCLHTPCYDQTFAKWPLSCSFLLAFPVGLMEPLLPQTTELGWFPSTQCGAEPKEPPSVPTAAQGCIQSCLVSTALIEKNPSATSCLRPPCPQVGRCGALSGIGLVKR